MMSCFCANYGAKCANIEANRARVSQGEARETLIR